MSRPKQRIEPRCPLLAAIGRPSAALLFWATAVLLLVTTGSAQAQSDPAPLSDPTWFAEVFGKIGSPWFWFGMTAQFVFFMRFVVQWVVSERRRRSTVPVAFWYLSIVGSLALFVYAVHERDPVIMAGQLLACVIYIRNLMLISDWRKRRRQAGLPVTDPDEEETESTTVLTGKTAR